MIKQTKSRWLFEDELHSIRKFLYPFLYLPLHPNPLVHSPFLHRQSLKSIPVKGESIKCKEKHQIFTYDKLEPENSLFLKNNNKRQLTNIQFPHNLLLS